MGNVEAGEVAVGHIGPPEGQCACVFFASISSLREAMATGPKKANPNNICIYIHIHLHTYLHMDTFAYIHVCVILIIRDFRPALVEGSGLQQQQQAGHF